MLLHGNVGIEVVQSAVRLVTSLPLAVVDALNLIVATTRTLAVGNGARKGDKLEVRVARDVAARVLVVRTIATVGVAGHHLARNRVGGRNRDTRRVSANLRDEAAGRGKGDAVKVRRVAGQSVAGLRTRNGGGACGWVQQAVAAVVALRDADSRGRVGKRLLRARVPRRRLGLVVRVHRGRLRRDHFGRRGSERVLETVRVVVVATVEGSGSSSGTASVDGRRGHKVPRDARKRVVRGIRRKVNSRSDRSTSHGKGSRGRRNSVKRVKLAVGGDREGVWHSSRHRLGGRNLVFLRRLECEIGCWTA